MPKKQKTFSTIIPLGHPGYIFSTIIPFGHPGYIDPSELAQLKKWSEDPQCANAAYYVETLNKYEITFKEFHQLEVEYFEKLYGAKVSTSGETDNSCDVQNPSVNSDLTDQN